jgi:hypothetical protein
MLRNAALITHFHVPACVQRQGYENRGSSRNRSYAMKKFFSLMGLPCPDQSLTYNLIHRSNFGFLGQAC